MERVLSYKYDDCLLIYLLIIQIEFNKRKSGKTSREVLMKFGMIIDAS